MKSWAVTRGPSLVPGEKRLAVEVEDHPIEYNKFEGTIPKGQYGGGTVMIWDKGRWIPEGDPHYGYRKGHLNFRLEGEKLHGSWHLVRMHKKPGERQEPWLLIKSDDEAARGPGDRDILDEAPLSATTARSMEEIAEGKPKGKAKAKSKAVPGSGSLAWTVNRSGSASIVTCPPNELMRIDVHRRRYVRSRSRSPAGSAQRAATFRIWACSHVAMAHLFSFQLHGRRRIAMAAMRGLLRARSDGGNGMKRFFRR